MTPDEYGEQAMALRSQLRRWAFTRVPGHVDIDDIVDGAIARGLAWCENVSSDELLPFLHACVNNAIVDDGRKYATRAQTRDAVREHVREAHLRPTPLDALVSKEDREAARKRIVRALAALPPRQREALTLVLEGASRREIEKAMGTSEDGLDQLIKRARRRIRQGTA